jgi:Bacterial nucleoid DNA-binding protein
MVGISELSKEVSKKTGETQKVAREIIKVFLDEVIDEANEKQKINLAGFGIFERKTQKSRTAKNPQTRKEIKVPQKENLFSDPRAR